MVTDELLIPGRDFFSRAMTAGQVAINFRVVTPPQNVFQIGFLKLAYGYVHLSLHPLIRLRWLLRHDRKASRPKRERLSTSRVIGIAGHKARRQHLTQLTVGIHLKTAVFTPGAGLTRRRRKDFLSERLRSLRRLR